MTPNGVEVAVHDLGANVNFSILETDVRKSTEVREMDLVAWRPADGLLAPDAWTHELDLRPWIEKF